METPEEDHGDHERPMNSSSDNNLDNNNSLSDPEILPDMHHRSHDFLETLMGVAGNVLEWYDFAGEYEKLSHASPSSFMLHASPHIIVPDNPLFHFHSLWLFFGYHWGRLLSSSVRSLADH